MLDVVVVRRFIIASGLRSSSLVALLCCACVGEGPGAQGSTGYDAAGDGSFDEETGSGEGEDEGEDVEGGLAAEKELRFKNVTTRYGLGKRHGPEFDDSCIERVVGDPYPVIEDCSVQRSPGGAAIADYDGDGWPDVFLPRPGMRDLLYRNLGGEAFEEVGLQMGLAEEARSTGASWADLDLDGDLDLVVSTQGDQAHRIYLQREGGFEPLPRDWADAFQGGMGVGGTSVQIGDLDLDGYPDLIFLEWMWESQLVEGAPQHARILRNRGVSGDPQFDDVTVEIGLSEWVDGDVATMGFSASTADFNLDGWPDLLIAADYGKARLYLGDGQTLTELDDSGLETVDYAMGTAIADIDGDGDLDAYISSIGKVPGVEIDFGEPADYNHVLLNDGTGRFSSDPSSGADTCSFSWGTLAADLDLDGRIDLASTNGWYHVDPILNQSYREDRSCLFLRESPQVEAAQGRPRFANRSGPANFSDRGQGRGLYAFDFDRDGDLDLLEVRNGEPAILWQNDKVPVRAWLNVEARGLAGTADQRQALVAVRRSEGDDWRIEAIGQNSTFLGHGELMASFGLGYHAGSVAGVRVCWPDLGLMKELVDVAPRQHLVVEPTGEVEVTDEPCGTAVLRD